MPFSLYFFKLLSSAKIGWENGCCAERSASWSGQTGTMSTNTWVGDWTTFGISSAGSRFEQNNTMGTMSPNAPKPLPNTQTLQGKLFWTSLDLFHESPWCISPPWTPNPTKKQHTFSEIFQRKCPWIWTKNLNIELFWRKTRFFVKLLQTVN